MNVHRIFGVAAASAMLVMSVGTGAALAEEESSGTKPGKPDPRMLTMLAFDVSDDLAEGYYNPKELDELDVDSDWACKKPKFKKRQKKAVVKCYGQIEVTHDDDEESTVYCGTTKVTLRKGKKRKPNVHAKWVGKRTKATADEDGTYCPKYEKYSEQSGFGAEPPSFGGEQPSEGDQPAEGEEPREGEHPEDGEQRPEEGDAPAEPTSEEL